MWCKGLWILDWPGPAAGSNIQKYSMFIVGWARSGFWVGWVLAIELVCGFVLGRWVRLGLTAKFMLGLWSGALGGIVECEGPFFCVLGLHSVFWGDEIEGISQKTSQPESLC